MNDLKETLDLKTNTPQVDKCEKYEENQEILFKIKKCLMCTVDSVISIILIAPLVVGFWRGTWMLMDFHADYFPLYESLLFSVIIHVCFLLTRQFLKDYVDKDRRVKKQVRFVVFRRMHTYVYSAICVMQWRGAWKTFDQLFHIVPGAPMPDVVEWIGVVLVSSTFLLAVMKSLRNTVATPFVIALDTSDAAFNFPTRFRVSMVEKTSLYVLDCIFSVLIVGTLVVFVWRGAWVLLDIFLFPESEVWSAWSSLILGYTAVGLAFLMQPAMRWVCDRLQGALRLFAADMFLIFSLLGTVNVWRGIWMLLNLYFLPDNLELSCWLTHWLCLILLILLGCSNSLLVRGVYIDAEEPAGKCVVFPCYYLRLIFQQERAKKIAKRLQLDVMTKRKQEIDGGSPPEINHVTTINQLAEKEANNHVV